MTTVMIADFSGMSPLRDPLLLSDNSAQYANNTWLYRGQVRGFRASVKCYSTKYQGTTGVYRIPINPAAPPDFTTAGSYWLEFPDPFMAVVRNPTVGDTFNRYYFFPSNQYSSSGTNPSWPATSPGPVFNTLTRIAANQPPIKLGVPAPTGGPPTVTPPSIAVTHISKSTTTDHVSVQPTAIYLPLDSVANILVGMEATDNTTTTVSAAANATSAAGTISLFFSSTGGGPTDPAQIRIGMAVQCTSNPSAVFAGATVVSTTTTSVNISIALTANVVIGDTFQFINSGQILGGTTVVGVFPATTPYPVVSLSAGAAAAGIMDGDQISFNTAIPETRAYLYTYVTTYGEESMPSPATVATGDPTGTWVVVIPKPPTADNASGTLMDYRLYRTVTDSSGNATYYQVTEVPINFSGTTTINDSALAASITANLVLSTIGYAPPPAGLQGVVMMANGIAAGFTNQREIWFSAAYYLHAWPAAYALTVDYPIVGLTADGTSLNIMTEGSPFIATGVTPDTMTIGKVTANDPCISRGSIVSSGEGAYYASPNGIILLNSGGTTNITQNIYEKEFHYTLLPPQWASGKYGQTYATFIKGTPAPSPSGFAPFGGFVIDQTDANVPFSYLRFPNNVVNGYSDELSGQLFILEADGGVYQWNPPIPTPDTTTLRTWQWKTKQFRFTTPQQFKAFMVLFDVPPEVTITLGARNTSQSQVFNSATQYLTVTVYADGNQVVIREVQKSGEVLLITGGFKAEVWEFLFQGQIGMNFFKVASSVKELKAA